MREIEEKEGFVDSLKTATIVAGVLGVLMYASRTKKGKAVVSGIHKSITFSNSINSIKKLFRF